MALRHLSLRDFVIVPALDLALGAGFSALTGETGAGKSILIDALQLALGGRGDALWVREGQPRCEIGAEFDTPASAQPWLEERGFDTAAGTLLLRRTIDSARPQPRLDQRLARHRPSCANWANGWWTSTASTPGRA